VRLLRSVLVAACLALAAPATSMGADTRAEYIAQVDPICKRADKRIFPLAKQAFGAWDRGELGKAGRGFSRVARVFGASIAKVAAVPPPVADQALIGDWLDLERRDVALTAGIGAALRQGKEGKARKLVKKSIAIEKPIDRLVGDYGFKECN
jgi:hypothetical protein